MNNHQKAKLVKILQDKRQRSMQKKSPSKLVMILEIREFYQRLMVNSDFAFKLSNQRHYQQVAFEKMEQQQSLCWYYKYCGQSLLKYSTECIMEK
ncbi:unnamed protein product [Paramecium sonneborni]|uniref:Uncharacterized protein n=1 Tax=Paramecium sonneborni TaxID=65129 RepID=A0A8S1QY19_9CILI|nr:unnamed protein product [Paramecium sonneborni]